MWPFFGRSGLAERWAEDAAKVTDLNLTAARVAEHTGGRRLCQAVRVTV